MTVLLFCSHPEKPIHHPKQDFVAERFTHKISGYPVGIHTESARANDADSGMETSNNFPKNNPLTTAPAATSKLRRLSHL
jgi:hypothetical protein